MGMRIYHATPLSNLDSIYQSGVLKGHIVGESDRRFMFNGDTMSSVPQPYGPVYDGVYFADSVEVAANFVSMRNPSLDLGDIAVIAIRKDILRKHYGRWFRRSYDHSQKSIKAYVVWNEVDLRKTKAKVITYETPELERA